MTAQARGPTPTSGLQPRPTRRGVSIALVLAVTLSSLVMLAVASVIAINFTIGRENTLELLRERGELAVSAAVSQVRSQLDPAVQQLNYLANVIGSLDEPLEDSSRVADLLNGALAATPQISRIVFTSAQLQLTAAERNESGAKISASDQTTNLLLRRNLAQAEAHHEGWWAELILDPRGSGVTLLNRRHPVWHGATFVGELLAFVSVREIGRAHV